MPRGTGVMASTIGSIASKSASPHRLPASSTLMPTSSTVWPGWKKSRPYAFARPVARITTSPLRTMAGRLLVREWHVVTVAWRSSRSTLTGLPTTKLRPTTTTRLPAMGMSYASSISMQAAAVQGAYPGPRPVNTAAMEPRPMPSTSFAGLSASQTASSSNWAGRGRNMRQP